MTSSRSDLEIFKITSRESKDVIAFFGKLNPLSNFHPAAFTIEEYNYHFSKQFIQHTKALHFGDTDSADRIMNTTTAQECKSISINIEHFDEDKWNEVAKNLCAKGINEKFLQNPPLLDVLLTRTSTKTIIEATKDDIWGTGTAIHSPNCLLRNKWVSQGIMGEILQELRDEIRKTNPTSTVPSVSTHTTAAYQDSDDQNVPEPSNIAD